MELVLTNESELMLGDVIYFERSNSHFMILKKARHYNSKSIWKVLKANGVVTEVFFNTVEEIYKVIRQ